MQYDLSEYETALLSAAITARKKMHQEDSAEDYEVVEFWTDHAEEIADIAIKAYLGLLEEMDEC